jgi:hypothetical protein
MLQNTKREDFERYLHISYTQLNTYLKCPQKYEFQYVRGIPWGSSYPNTFPLVGPSMKLPSCSIEH